jgi:hypothetical protein
MIQLNAEDGAFSRCLEIVITLWMLPTNFDAESTSQDAKFIARDALQFLPKKLPVCEEEYSLNGNM